MPSEPNPTAEQNIQVVAGIRDRAAKRRTVGQRISDAASGFAARETSVLESQHRLKQEEDRRAQLDLQVNLLAEQEMTLVLRMLQEVCEHLGLEKTVTSATFKELVKST